MLVVPGSAARNVVLGFMDPASRATRSAVEFLNDMDRLSPAVRRTRRARAGSPVRLDNARMPHLPGKSGRRDPPGRHAAARPEHAWRAAGNIATTRHLPGTLLGGSEKTA
ncbi:hypothetical protein ACRAWF_24440 [Streptomyces sp. L7]